MKLDHTQIDARSLIQVERNGRALRRMQERMMHMWSTLDWLQSNNISCCTLDVLSTFGHY